MCPIIDNPTSCDRRAVIIFLHELRELILNYEQLKAIQHRDYN
jgi:hypothetical protein